MQKSYYAIIPANVRYDKELTPNAKLLYGEITALCNERGYCWATNSYFSELYGVSNKSISKWVNQLINKGYIRSELIYKKDSKEIESRHIYIGGVVTPMEEKFHRYGTEVHEGREEKFHTPMEEKVKDNNTFINTTVNNTTEQQRPSISNELDNLPPKEKSVVVDASFGELTNFYEQNIGLITPFVSEQLGMMVDDLNAELTLLALKESVLANARNKIRYAQKILDSWMAQKFKTADDVKNAEKRREVKQDGTNSRPIEYEDGLNF